MAAAGEPATCVAAAREPAANVTASVSTAYMAATCVSTRCAAIGMNATTIACASTESAAIAIAATIAVAIAATIPVAPTAVIPRASANEEATDEPARTVIAVGSAAIRCVRIIAPIADRGTIGIGRVDYRRTDAHPHCHLGICRGRESKRQNQEHCHQNQPKTFHSTPPCAVPSCLSGFGIRRVTSVFQHPPAWVFLPSRHLAI
jgi:hypothetical protein